MTSTPTRERGGAEFRRRFTRHLNAVGLMVAGECFLLAVLGFMAGHYGSATISLAFAIGNAVLNWPEGRR